MNSNIVLQNKTEIKKLLKINFNFIKYDGYILDKFIEYLLETNNYILDKTIQYVELLSKKSITDKFVDIIKEYETSKEITDSSLAIIQNANLQLQQIQEKHDKLQEKHDKLQDNINTINDKSIVQVKLINDTANNTIKECELRIEYSKNEIVKKQTEYNLLQDNINGIFRNEIYEDEYIYEESKDIIKEPLYHLKDGLKFPQEINIYGMEGRYNNWIKYDKKSFYFNFPIDVKLQNNEYIIKYYINLSTSFYNDSIDYIKEPILYYCLYITNYGRLIKSHVVHIKYIIPALLDDKPFHYDPIECITINNNMYQRHDIVYRYSTYSAWAANNGYNITSYNLDIKHIEQPKLNYRIPKLFIDVIDAFHTMNTDLMQECCKKYLDITRETERKNEILTSLQFNKVIKEKDDNNAIKDNKIIELSTIISSQTEELEKIKLENSKLKQALQSFI